MVSARRDTVCHQTAFHQTNGQTIRMPPNMCSEGVCIIVLMCAQIFQLLTFLDIKCTVLYFAYSALLCGCWVGARRSSKDLCSMLCFLQLSGIFLLKKSKWQGTISVLSCFPLPVFSLLKHLISLALSASKKKGQNTFGNPSFYFPRPKSWREEKICGPGESDLNKHGGQRISQDEKHCPVPNTLEKEMAQLMPCCLVVPPESDVRLLPLHRNCSFTNPPVSLKSLPPSRGVFDTTALWWSSRLSRSSFYASPSASPCLPSLYPSMF